MIKHQYILLTITIKKENAIWIGECEELGTSTFGDSFEEVDKEIKELVTLHLSSLEKAGERDRFFRENGITLYSDTIPKDISVTTSVRKDTYIGI